MAISNLSRFDLQVGMFITISTKDNLFLVISRDDAMFNICRCGLIDKNGKFYDYDARMNSFDFKFLPNDFEISAYDEAEVEQEYGNETLRKMYEAAKKYIENSSFYKEYHVHTLANEVDIAKKISSLTNTPSITKSYFYGILSNRTTTDESSTSKNEKHENIIKIGRN